MLLAAAFALALLGPKGHAKQPAWLDFSIASYILRYDDSHGVLGVHDSKTGYYLLRTVECDGGIVELSLTKDRNEVENYGFPARDSKEASTYKLIEKPLPSLSTGHGVRIG